MENEKWFLMTVSEAKGIKEALIKFLAGENLTNNDNLCIILNRLDQFILRNDR